MPFVLTYRSVKGSPLSSDEGDANTHNLDGRVSTLESSVPAAAVGIDDFEVSGRLMTVLMTDSTTRGPFTLPVFALNFLGPWEPATLYAFGDVVTADGGLYLVIFNHTSASDFDPGANDGIGDDFYRLIFIIPGGALPIGGVAGQILRKINSVNFQCFWDDDLLELLADVAISSDGPVTGEVLTWLGTVWGNAPPAATSFAELTDVDVGSDGPDSGDVAVFNGTDWVPEALDFANIAGVAAPLQIRQPVNALPAATGAVLLDPTLGDVFTVTPTGSITLTAASAPAGAHITLVVTTSGTSSFNVTPSTNFKSTGALATGTASGKVFTISFVGDGTNLNEISRTAAM